MYSLLPWLHVDATTTHTVVRLLNLLFVGSSTQLELDDGPDVGRYGTVECPISIHLMGIYRSVGDMNNEARGETSKS